MNLISPYTSQPRHCQYSRMYLIYCWLINFLGTFKKIGVYPNIALKADYSESVL